MPAQQTPQPKSVEEWRELLQSNLQALQTRLHAVCQTQGRDPGSVTLVAVSKKQPPEAIRAAYQLGLRDFGENYVQEWQSKALALKDLPHLRWHFIGHLQTNKVKDLLKPHPPSLLHTLDRPALLEALAKRPGPWRVLIQLQVDPHKQGAAQTEAEALYRSAQATPSVQVLGFMGMAPADLSSASLQHLFDEFQMNAQKLWDRPGKPILSLGMSQDWEEAVASGATHLRIGTALFGSRTYT